MESSFDILLSISKIYTPKNLTTPTTVTHKKQGKRLTVTEKTFIYPMNNTDSKIQAHFQNFSKNNKSRVTQRAS